MAAWHAIANPKIVWRVQETLLLEMDSSFFRVQGILWRRPCLAYTMTKPIIHVIPKHITWYIWAHYVKGTIVTKIFTGNVQKEISQLIRMGTSPVSKIFRAPPTVVTARGQSLVSQWKLTQMWPTVWLLPLSASSLQVPRQRLCLPRLHPPDSQHPLRVDFLRTRLPGCQLFIRRKLLLLPQASHLLQLQAKHHQWLPA